jgi:putative SOS response-associated peptidase YedK
MTPLAVPITLTTDSKEVPAIFDARAESIATSGMFRDAFRRDRCIVPASGFYGWTGDR